MTAEEVHFEDRRKLLLPALYFFVLFFVDNLGGLSLTQEHFCIHVSHLWLSAQVVHRPLLERRTA